MPSKSSPKTETKNMHINNMGQKNKLDIDSELQLSRDDLLYEQDILRNPSSVRTWLQYINHKKHSSVHTSLKSNSKTQKDIVREVCVLFERSLLALQNNSYKVWHNYLNYRRYILTDDSSERITNNYIENKPEYDKLNVLYERCLLTFYKYPRIWLDYLSFLMLQPNISKTRTTFNLCLKTLPVTQHLRIWKLYLKFGDKAGGLTSLSIYKRYLQFEKKDIELFIEQMEKIEQFDEAIEKIMEVLEHKLETRNKKTTEYEFYIKLVKIACLKPLKRYRKKVKAIVLKTTDKYPEIIDELICMLAEHYILNSKIQKARDTFEYGMVRVSTVKHFTTIFDAYTKFEETIINTLVENLNEINNDSVNVKAKDEIEKQIDYSMQNFENLLERRPLLVNDVMLRQNPNNVAEWIKRTTLYEDRDKVININNFKIKQTFELAIETINPKKCAKNQLPELFIKYVQFYESNKDNDQDKECIEKIRNVYEHAVAINYATVDDLVRIWKEYCEFETKNNNHKTVVDLLSRALEPPKNHRNINYYDESISVQKRLFKSQVLWSYYLDILECVASFETVCAGYEKMLNLKLITPQILVDYCTYLQSNKYFEKSYKIYERGLEYFTYPIAFEIWNVYLTQFVERLGQTKVERVRDLFEQALDKCPPNYAKDIFILYGEYEEKRGLYKKAMHIYDRATQEVNKESKYSMFEYYIAKAKQFFGLVATRDIYEKAISTLNDQETSEICIKYAGMELKLGEVDRTRAIYAYASQFSDPRIKIEFWQIWHDFEVRYGNEDTFKEMLRIKRSVQAKFNTEIDYLSAQLLLNNNKKDTITGFIKEKGTQHNINSTDENEKQVENNPDQIQI